MSSTSENRREEIVELVQLNGKVKVSELSERYNISEVSIRKDLEALEALSTDELLEALMSIKGVGLKVASCVALFAYGRLDCFPIDVWIKRVLDKYYPDGFDHKALPNTAGLVQQYLFYYERYNKDEV